MNSYAATNASRFGTLYANTWNRAMKAVRRTSGEDQVFARQGGHMNKNFLRHARVAAAAVVLLCAVASWANTGPTSEVKQVGATAILYRGPQVQVAISYRSPKRNPGASWLMLDTAMTATKEPIEIPRTAISVRTPDGQVVPLASHEAYSKGYPDLAAAIIQDNAIGEPLGYLIPHRYRRLDYFPRRGVGLAWPSVWLDEWHNTYGRLFFQLPGGIQKGNYELLINLPQSQVVIPFTI
jgi:hypothetical protein